MLKLLALYFGTIALAALSQHYYPRPALVTGGSDKHFLRARPDIYLLIIIIWLTLFNGLKTSYNDTFNYIREYTGFYTDFDLFFADFGYFSLSGNWLYYMCEMLHKMLFDNLHLWFMTSAALIAYISAVVLKKYSVNFPITLAVFYGIGTYVMYIAAIKQSIAVSICMISVPFLIKKKWLWYYSLVVLAMLFHTHAFMFLVLPLFLEKPFGRVTWISVGAVLLAMLTYNMTLGAFLEFGQRIGANVDAGEVFDGHSINPLRVAVYAVVPIMMFIFRKRLFEDSTTAENLFANMSILSLLILSIGLVEGANLFARMAGYFEWSMAIVLPWCITKIFSKKSQKYIFWFAGILFTLYFLYEFGVSKGFGAQYRAITIVEFIESLLP